MIIDAHVHLPVVDGCITLEQKKERLLREMAINQVDYCIVISDSTMQSEIGTLDECVKLFEKTDNVYVVGGIGPHYEFQMQLSKLRVYLDQRMIVGIKLFPGHEAFYLTDERIQEVYELGIRYNVPVLFHSGWDNSEYADVSLVTEVAGQYPDLKLVCCHCFYPEIEKCMQLIQFPNVYFDISSVADDPGKVPEIAGWIKKLISVVPTRILYGSDYACCNQGDHIAFVRKLRLEKAIEDMIFWQNAGSVFQFGGI